MVIALIPVPVLRTDLNQQVKRRELTAVDTKVLIKVGVHQRHGGVMGTGIHDFRFRQRH